MKKSVMNNKKAQDLSIGTLILIVLGVVVLVLLILGFSMGWSNLWEKINIFGGGSSISTVASACDLAAQQDNKYSYCQEFKKVKVGQENEYLNCEDLRIQTSINTKLSCDASRAQVNQAKKDLCAGFSDNERSKAKINNQKCDVLFPDDYNSDGTAKKACGDYEESGKKAAEKDACDVSTEKEVPSTQVKITANKKCCIAR
ncbi:MAG: hypothetical protein KKD18_03920 [Nanoarchaeota archaeon]|nr:hypothetical protein [Nanoarchaeota archaeon]